MFTGPEGFSIAGWFRLAMTVSDAHIGADENLLDRPPFGWKLTQNVAKKLPFEHYTGGLDDENRPLARSGEER